MTPDTRAREFDAADPLGHFLKILSAIALYLGLDEHWFDPAIAGGNSVLRLLHYPPLAGATDGAVRAGAHEDINLITLLLGAEEAGLELLGKDGEWISASPPPGALVVNDVISALTLAYNLLVGGMLIPLIGAIFWKRATTAGAIASMGLGFATALLFMFKDGLDANTPIYYSLAVGLVSFVVVSLLSPRPATVASAI